MENSVKTALQQQQELRAAIAEFPSTFRLRGFPGEEFRVSVHASYSSKGEPVIYTERLKNGEWNDFAKGTVAEIRAQILK